MVNRVIYINLGLVLVCAFFAIQTVQVWTSDRLEAVQHNLSGRSKTSGPPQRSLSKLKNSVPPKSTFQDMVTHNVFSMDRQEYKPSAVESESVDESAPIESAPEVKGRRIVLHGVIALDSIKRALISDPEAQSADSPVRWVQMNDRVGDLKVEAIQHDSLILADGPKKYKVLLYDKDKPQTRPSRSTAKAPQPAAKTQQPAVVTTATQPPPEAAAAPAPKQVTKPRAQEPTDDGYVIINTPFGQIKRKKQ